MPQRLPLTEKLRGLIASATDGDVDPEKVAIFESRSLNSLPVKKRNIFDGAVHPESTLREMVASVAARPLKNHVPVHTVHAQSYGELPVGKVFHAELLDEGGVKEVRSLFYLGENEKDLIAKVESGAIEEVSVGVSYKHINCSQCGWDYMGADAEFEHFYDRKCANGHEIGKDGVHVILNGLDRWMEQSLVSLGAAQGAKIVSRAKALLGQSEYNALAASGKDPSATILFASATPLPEKNEMDLTQLVKELTDAKVLIAQKDGEIAALKLAADKVGTLEKTVADLTTRVAELSGSDAAKLTLQLSAAQEESKAALSLVRKEADRLAVAAGEKVLPAEATLAELSAAVENFRTKLSATFTGAPALELSSTVENTLPGASNPFKTRK